MSNGSEKKPRGRPREDRYSETDLLIIDRAEALAATSRKTHSARFWIARVLESIRDRKPDELQIWIGLEGGVKAIDAGGLKSAESLKSVLTRVMSRMRPQPVTMWDPDAKKSVKIGTIPALYSGPSAPFLRKDLINIDAPERSYVGPVRFHEGLAESIDRRRGWKDRKKPA